MAPFSQIALGTSFSADTSVSSYRAPLCLNAFKAGWSLDLFLVLGISDGTECKKFKHEVSEIQPPSSDVKSSSA